MMSKPSLQSAEPRWHSIAFLPILAAVMHDNARDARKQAQRMAVALEQPDSLDRAVLMRMGRAYSGSASYMDVFGEQLRKWRVEYLTGEERQTLDELDEILGQWRDDVQTVVAAARKLLDQTAAKAGK